MEKENYHTKKRQNEKTFDTVGSFSDEVYDSYLNSCSATDCTGLIPSLPQSKEEIDSYEALYHFLPKASGPKQTK